MSVNFEVVSGNDAETLNDFNGIIEANFPGALSVEGVIGGSLLGSMPMIPPEGEVVIENGPAICGSYESGEHDQQDGDEGECDQ